MRTMAPALRRCLERANPHVATFVELSVPDQSQILHRQDQFLAAPALVSMTPAASAVASPSGALTLASTAQRLIDQYVDGGWVNIPQEDLEHYVNTAAWQISKAFGGGVLRSVTVRVKFLNAASLGGGIFLFRPDLKLYIFRATQVAGVLRRQDGSSTIEQAQTQTTFTQLLPEPVVVRYASIAGIVDGSGFCDVTFDLTPFHLLIEPVSSPRPSPAESGELPELYFSVQTNQSIAGNLVEWRRDTTTAQTIASVGKVRELSWIRATFPGAIWVSSETGPALMLRVDIDQYAATSQAVHALTLPALPDPASLGRIVFNRTVPAGTAAALELSTVSAIGPFTAVTHGDAVAVQQLTYHARVTLNASADQRRAPVVSAIGVEFRDRVDVSAESSVTHMSQEIAVPWLAASVGEGSIVLARTGRRDYGDVGGSIAIAGADTKLEADVYLGSRHPSVTRDAWLHLARATVSNRKPTATSEVFPLLSIAKLLKRKIPEQAESINQPVVVYSATATQVTIVGTLPGATSTGNEYDAAGYYLRVRASAVAGIDNATFNLVGNTGVDKIDFGGLPSGTFLAGDVLEIHSGRFLLPTLEWVDEDPAAVWWAIFGLLQIPPERIGFSEGGQNGRSGLPPTIADRAPGDVGEQAKLRVTLRLTQAELGDALIDELSFIMGGATVEIAGQFVFVQVYPLKNAAGVVTVPCTPVAAVFDPRDCVGLETPTGREQRITVLTCLHGVNSTAAAPTPGASITIADVDALDVLGLQDVEGIGTASIPDNIARWCYNAADGGYLLALMLINQVLHATSTGVRAWPWSTVDAHPDLTVGDTVVVITDQYTDYDPVRRAAVNGWNAYALTLIGVSEGGRRFLGFLQGLAGLASAKLRGGAGGLLNAAPPSLVITGESDSADGLTHTIYFTRGATTAEVWAAYAVITAPESESDKATVAAAITPLPDGTTSYTVLKPRDGQLTIGRLEPRDAGGRVGTIVLLKIPAVPQVPAWAFDDIEGASSGTQWWKLTERGIAVASVVVQTQVGDAISAFAAPTRGSGGASLVHGGLLGPLEYEQDIAFDAQRSSYVVPRVTLENGLVILPTPLQFDRDKNPNLTRVALTLYTLDITANSDTKSVRVQEPVSGWEYWVDGVYLSVDVTKIGTNGVAGLGANTRTYTITAYREPKAYVVAGTANDVTTQVITGPGAAAPAATWDRAAMQVTPPAIGSTAIALTLKATGTTTGYTTTVYIGEILTRANPATTVDETANLTPALTVPPTTATSYAWTSAYPASVSTGMASIVTLKARCVLIVGGVAVDSVIVSCQWYTGGA